MKKAILLFLSLIFLNCQTAFLGGDSSMDGYYVEVTDREANNPYLDVAADYGRRLCAVLSSIPMEGGYLGYAYEERPYGSRLPFVYQDVDGFENTLDVQLPSKRVFSFFIYWEEDGLMYKDYLVNCYYLGNQLTSTEKQSAKRKYIIHIQNDQRLLLEADFQQNGKDYDYVLDFDRNIPFPEGMFLYDPLDIDYKMALRPYGYFLEESIRAKL